MLIAAVLASALLHAAWNALLRGHPDKRAGGVAVIGIAASVAVVVAAVFWAWTRRAPFPDATAFAATVVAGLFEAGYLVSLSRGLTIGALGPVYTVSRGLSLVLVWPLSVLIFAEPASGLAIGGAAVLLVGLAIAGLERGVPRAAIGWAIATAACIAGYHLVYKVALGHGAMPPAVFAVAIGLAVPVQAAIQRVSARAAVATVNARIVAAGLLCTASFLIFLWALRAAGAGAVLTLRNTSVVFAVGFGALVGDRPTARQIGGALLVAAGAAMVAA